jgi:multidrug efflux pump subunit AcrA (membrane-fusion protein)
MRIIRVTLVLFACLAIAGAALFLTRDHWLPWIGIEHADAHKDEDRRAPAPEAKTFKVSPQARQNLGLVVRPLALVDYWRTILVPGVIVDRPGHSDRGVPAPAVATVAKIHAFPGDTVKPGERLFTLRLISEYLQNTQSELFKATGELQLAQAKLDKLLELAKTVTIPEPSKVEAEGQVKRIKNAIQGYQQDLLTRGLTPAHIAGVAQGKFVSEIEVVAPEPLPGDRQLIVPKESPSSKINDLPAYEVQELKAELGQQVQAGQTLSILANHQSLYIEGHSFRREAPYLERAARHGWPLRVEFVEDDSPHWPPLEQSFHIRHLANTIDTASRTLDFYVPLTNQSRAYEKEGRIHLVWRFRPGQRARLHVPVEEYKDVLVLPAAAVAREGAEAYVFRQNGDLFDRRSVHVLHEDRLNIVIANDGSVAPGWAIAQNAAASLNRILKAQAASGMPAGMHVHPDGTVHGAH